jgi:hypothetical protein
MKVKIFALLAIILTTLFTCSKILEPEENEFTLMGIVEDQATGERIANADITVSGPEIEDYAGKSDSSGAFKLKPELDNTSELEVTISKESFLDTTITIEEAKPGEKEDLGIIRLTPDYQPLIVSGKLVNSFNNEPIVDGQIISDIFPEPIKSDEQGNFSFALIVKQSGTLTLIFKKMYFENDTVTVDLEPETNVNLGKILMDYKYDPATITGQVLDNRADTTLNHAKVSIEEYNVYTYTDNNGHFSLDVQINTTTTINVKFSKYPFETRTITIDPISPEEEIDVKKIKLVPPAYESSTIRGKVVDRREGEPLENVEVITDMMGSPAATNSSGYFEFNLQVDADTTLDFVFSKDYFNDTTLADVSLRPEKDRNLGEIMLSHKYKKVTISGKVLDNRTGQPIEGAKILYTGDNIYTSSNENGNFSLKIQINTPQSVELRISKDPYETITRTIDQVVPEEKVSIDNISLVPPAYEPISISGQIIDKDTGRPIENVVVNIDKFPQATTQTDQYGYFKISAQVDQTMGINITLSKDEMYNPITIADTLRPEVDLDLDIIEMDSKYDPINIAGQVIKYSDNNPLEGVYVKIIEFPNQTTQTDMNGEYSLNPVISEDQKIHIAFHKNTFKPDTAEIEVSPNTDVNVPQVPLLEEITKPASIIFIGADPQDIRVKETGGTENSILTFEVRDSSGVPIDISEDTTVFVRIIAGPDGGESIYPKELRTDSKGRVKTSLTSGTIAGPVEVEASLYTDDGDKIVSNPVSVVIHAGHPAQSHFSIAADQLNIPGLVKEGLQDEITATVGDRYGNWVSDGTPVRFSSVGGVIDGFATTTDAQATVILKSGGKDPEPSNQGFVPIIAQTTDKDGNTIETTGQVLFSGHPEITNFSPSDITLSQGGSVTVTFNVWDKEYNNPLAANTTLEVSANPDTLASVETTFPDDGLPDVQYGHTDYSITIIDNPNSQVGGKVNIKLELKGPNGPVTEIIEATLTD